MEAQAARIQGMGTLFSSSLALLVSEIMTSLSQTDPSSLQRRAPRRLLKLVVCLAFFFGSMAFLVPYGVQYYIQQWLLENGADHAEVGRIRFNPFKGSLTLHDTEIRQGERVVFSDSTIHVDLGVGMLLKRTVTLEHARLAGITLDVERDEDGGLRIASLSLPARDEALSKGAVAPLPEKKEIKGHGWVMAAKELDISHVSVQYTQPDLQVDLVVEQGTIRAFNTSSDDKGGMCFLKGTVNNTPVTVELNTFKLLPFLSLEGKVEVDGFDLSSLDGLLAPYLAPFSGTASVTGAVSVRMDEVTGLQTRYSGQLRVNEADVGGAGWRTGAGLLYDGTVIYSAGMDRGDSVVTEGVLSAEGLVVDLAKKTRLAQRKAVLKGAIGVEFGPQVKVAYDGNLTLEGTELNMDTMQTVLDHCTWVGKSEYELDDDRQTVLLQGMLTGKQLSLDLPGSGIHVEQQVLQTQSDVAINLGEPLGVRGNLSLQGDGFLLEQCQVPLLEVSTILVTEAGGTESGGIQIGKVAAEKIRLPASDTVPAAVSIQAVETRQASTSDFNTLQVEGIQTKDILVRDRDGERILAAWHTVQAQGVQVDEQIRVTVEAISAEEGRFLQDNQEQAEPFVSLGKITTSPLQWTAEKGLECEQVDILSLYAQYTRMPGGNADEKGETTSRVGGTGPAVQEAAPFAAEEPARQSEAVGIPVRIGAITIGGQSGFTFVDNSLSVPFSTTLQLESAKVTNLDLHNPDQTTAYALQGIIDQYAPLSVIGTCKPLGTPLQVKQTTTLRNYALPRISPYVAQTIGTYFDTGRMDVHSELTLEGDMIQVETNLLAKELKARTVNRTLVGALNKRLPVPLNLALSMLKDGEGNIDLDVPVSGKLSDVHVGVSDILITAVGKALSVAVAPYLAYVALGPSGALVFMGAKYGGSLLKTDFPTLSFEPQQLELTDRHKEILDRVGSELEKQGEEVYSICPRVALAELGKESVPEENIYLAVQDAATAQALRELGNARASLVKEYLIETYSIDEEKVLICDPGLNMKKNAWTVIEFKQ